ncbi:MAG TPA: PAS domain S-box protein [Candidatus Hydrogenedentes bacterium]|nr:PAS domain S-box protein [Candidatus Hydrogenedentota bacterium]
MRFGIRKRLAVAFLVLGICPVVLLVAVVGWQGFEFQKGSTLALQHERAKRVGTEFAAFIARIESGLDALTNTQPFHQLDPGNQKTLLAALMAHQPAFDAIVLVDDAGKERVRLSRMDEVGQGDGPDWSEKEAFQRPLEIGVKYFSPVRFDPTTDEPLITLSKPLLDEDSGDVRAVLIADLRLKPAWRATQAVAESDSEEVFIVDGQSRIVAHHDPSVVRAGALFKLPDHPGVWKTPAGPYACIACEQVRFGGQVFTVVIQRPLGEAMAEYLLGSALIAAFILLPTLVIGYMVARHSSRRIIEPIGALAKAAKAIEQGDLSRRAEIARNDEIGELAESFNSMTARLQRSLESLEQEVKERGQAEEALRASEERYRTLVDNLPQSIFQKDHNSVLVSCNASFAADLGMKPEDIIGKSDYDFFPEELAAKYRADDQRIMAGGVTEEIEERHVRLGEEIYVQVVKTPLKDEVGNIRGLLGIFWDITERKKAEQALRESEARYRLVAENVSDVIWTRDLDLRLTYVSPSVHSMLGYTVQEAIALDIEAQFTPASLQVLRRAVGQEKDRFDRNPEAAPPSRTLELEQYCRDGSTVWAEVTISFLSDGTGHPVGILGVARDVTQRRRLQAQVQHAQKLESLGVLAGGIAHDFNNLLMGILGNASLALMELSPKTKAHRNVEQIERAGMRAAELAKQMLAYSGKGRFVVEPVSVPELVEEMAHLLDASISKKAVVKYNFADNVPQVEGDPTQIRQVIMNLITNASEALEEKSGIISISTGVTYIDRTYLADTYVDDDLPEGPYAFLEVQDTGCGMDEETKRRLFDPFFTTKFMGRGLGLAAVLGIIRAHGGAIKVYSELGRGSTFRVFLPCAESTAQATRDSTEEDVVWRGAGTVLLVDDEETVRTVGKMMLEELGFNVLVAKDGQEGVDVYREHANEVDIVLLDMTMPRLSGEQAFAELRRIRPDVRVLLSSGYNEQEATHRFAGKGLAGFLQKPYQPMALRDKLREILGV